MSFKRFISGVCAFAVAVTAFAAMTVTANAKDYSENIALVANDAYNMASYSGGIATAKALGSGAYAGIRKSFSGLTDIADASTVTVEFDTAVSSGNVVIFGFGDASECTAMAGGGGNYKPDGRAIYFGSTDGSSYKAYDVKSGAALNIGSTAFGKVVHAKITLDRTAGKYSYYIGYSDTAKISGNGIATNIGNLTYVDAYTKTSGAAFRFNNIKVSYTVPKAPTAGTPSEVEVLDNQGNDGVYAKAYTCDITYDGIAIENVMVEVPGSNEVSQTISFGNGYSGNVLIGIILASKDPTKIKDIPTVTANVN